jgi:hypothetical protein
MTTTFALALTLTLLFVSVYAQRQMLSPRKSAEITLAGKKISVDYGAPSVRGRKIFGTLVPYNQVWRFGANEATHLKTEADLMFGSVSVPKGTYTLYAWPSENGLKLIINKQTGQWGTQYDQGQDLARIDMKVEKTKAPVEQMVISLAQAGKGGVLKMDWENTSASVNFTAK